MLRVNVIKCLTGTVVIYFKTVLVRVLRIDTTEQKVQIQDHYFFPINIEINVINSWMRCTGVTCACRGEVYDKEATYAYDRGAL
jgi:hypothetical protein